jgi:hypothetical protein
VGRRVYLNSLMRERNAENVAWHRTRQSASARDHHPPSIQRAPAFGCRNYSGCAMEWRVLQESETARGMLRHQLVHLAAQLQQGCRPRGTGHLLDLKQKHRSKRHLDTCFRRGVAFTN